MVVHVFGVLSSKRHVRMYSSACICICKLDGARTLTHTSHLFTHVCVHPNKMYSCTHPHAYAHALTHTSPVHPSTQVPNFVICMGSVCGTFVMIAVLIPWFIVFLIPIFAIYYSAQLNYR